MPVGLQQALPGEVFDLVAPQVASEVFQVASRQAAAQRPALEAQVQKVDQAEAAFGQLQDVAQMQRAEVDAAPVQVVDEFGQGRQQRIELLALLAVQLVQRAPGQGRIEAGADGLVAVEPQAFADLGGRDLAATQALGVAGEALRRGT